MARVIPARSENDTGNNPHNPVYGIARAGANGEFVATIGTRNSESGGRSDAPGSMILSEFRPTKVSNRNEAVGLVGDDAGDGFPNGRVAQRRGHHQRLKLGKINETAGDGGAGAVRLRQAVATLNTTMRPRISIRKRTPSCRRYSRTAN